MSNFLHRADLSTQILPQKEHKLTKFMHANQMKWALTYVYNALKLVQFADRVAYFEVNLTLDCPIWQNFVFYPRLSFFMQVFLPGHKRDSDRFLYMSFEALAKLTNVWLQKHFHLRSRCNLSQSSVTVFSLPYCFRCCRRKWFQDCIGGKAHNLTFSTVSAGGSEYWIQPSSFTVQKITKMVPKKATQ